MSWSSAFLVTVLSYSLMIFLGYTNSWSLNTIILSVPKFTDAHNGITDSLIESVSLGVLGGLNECKHQFKWDLWNCPETPSTVLGRDKISTTKVLKSYIVTEILTELPEFFVVQAALSNSSALKKINELVSRDMSTDFDMNQISQHAEKRAAATREAAFLQAILSAGVMHHVTRDCSRGNQTFCDCVRRPRSKQGQTWSWGGCSDNVEFGEKIANHLIKSTDIGQDRHGSVQLHNRQVGNKAVKRSMRYHCKCHGICGACTVKTCWKQLGDFRLVGDFLRRRYQKAVHIRSDGLQRRGNQARTIQLPRVSKRKLVYMEESPNYCNILNPLVYTGPLRRQCIRPGKAAPKWERSSCRNICKNCGRNVTKVVLDVVDKCDCRFRWCCEVECKECVRKVAHYFCK